MHQWLKSNLSAVASAAVFAVYAAGYAKTRTAAARFANESNDRSASAQRPPLADTAPAQAAVVAPAPAQTPVPAAAAAATATTTIPPLKRTATAPAVADSQSKPTPAVRAETATVPIRVDTTAATVPKTPVATAPPMTPPAMPTTIPADTGQPGAKERAGWKDGTYTGYGTSRHGDIEATIVVQNGKISSASISQCLTRYSCSWISQLPSQVVTRQSADVDYVSGATQSSNAFYYAIVEALNKAK